MTEQEWLVSDDPDAMRAWLQHPASEREHLGLNPASDRQLSLWVKGMAALASHDYEYTDGDGLISDVLHDPEKWANAAYDSEGDPPMAARAALLRDIIDNPWRATVALCGNTSHRLREGITRCVCDKCQSIQGWQHSTIPSMAQVIYDERTFDLMPQLGDALEEAGCDNAAILEHCRGQVKCDHLVPSSEPGAMLEYFIANCPKCRGKDFLLVPAVHVRGCWVLDLILGKE